MPVKMSPEDYAKVEAAINLQNDEDYTVVFHKRHGQIRRSVHVFSRQATTKEVSAYENTASRLKFKGNKAEIEGSQTLAAEQLYNKLIARVYDLPIGRRVYGEDKPLGAEEARGIVPVLVKREAIRDFLGEVYAASRFDEDGDDVSTPEGD